MRLSDAGPWRWILRRLFHGIHSLGALGFTVPLPLRLDDYALPIPYLVPGLEVKGLFGVTSECRTGRAGRDHRQVLRRTLN